MLLNDVKDYLTSQHTQYTLTPKGFKVIGRIEMLFPRKIKSYQLNIVDYDNPLPKFRAYTDSEKRIKKNFEKDIEKLTWINKALSIRPEGFNTQYLIRLYRNYNA